jgi:hypothetical protein
MNGPPVVIRMGGGPNVPVYVNEPLVVASFTRIASALLGIHDHCTSGASMPRGHTVASYG